MMRKVFGPKWEEVRGQWTKLHHQKLHVSRTKKWADHVARMKYQYRVLVGEN
jgi:hypothetical protein